MLNQASRFTNNVTWSHKKKYYVIVKSIKKNALLINLPAYFWEGHASISFYFQLTWKQKSLCGLDSAGDNQKCKCSFLVHRFCWSPRANTPGTFAAFKTRGPVQEYNMKQVTRCNSLPSSSVVLLILEYSQGEKATHPYSNECLYHFSSWDDKFQWTYCIFML